MAAVIEPPPGPVMRYCDALRAEVFTCITTGRPKAYVHRSEWAKVLAGARPAASSAVPSAAGGRERA